MGGSGAMNSRRLTSAALCLIAHAAKSLLPRSEVGPDMLQAFMSSWKTERSK